MQSISLQQPYDELTDLECLLNDAPRRMKLAQEYDYLRTPLQEGFHVVASGFSALAAVEGLRRCGPVTAVYDPSGSLDKDIFPNVDVLPFDKLKNAHKGIVVAATAPAMAQGLMRLIDEHAGAHLERALLFAESDEENRILPNTRWPRLNMSYRCVNFAVNLSRRYRALPCDGKVATAIQGRNLAGLMARMVLAMSRDPFGGFVEPGQDAQVTGCHLLVTVAPHTFAGREAEFCDGKGYGSVQFLFREPDQKIPAFSLDGYANLRLLGAGEEGMVFQGISPQGEHCCYKAYFENRDRSELMDWITSLTDAAPGLSWMGRVRGISHRHAEKGVVLPFMDLAHIPFMEEGRDDVLRVLVNHCLQIQMEHVVRGRVPATMPGGIHTMCEKDGTLRFVDVGNLPPRIKKSSPEELKAAVVKGLAGLAHEALFCCKNWKIKDSARYLQSVAERLEENITWLPDWYPKLLRHVLGLDAGCFLDPVTFRNIQERYGLIDTVLPEDVTVRSHTPVKAVAPAPRVREHGQEWFHECLYQTFLYRPGEVRGYGRTGDKYALLRERFEREVCGASYMDIGSNQGFFMAQASLAGAELCTGIEQVPVLQIQSRRMFDVVGLKNVSIQGLRVAAHLPLPQHDVVTALAIIHHLYLVGGTFARFSDMVVYLARAARKCLFIEYIVNPGYLEKAQQQHKRDFSDYTEANMADSLKICFKNVEKLADVTDTRALYYASHC